MRYDLDALAANCVNLPRLGEGCSGAVFDLGDGNVFKNAHIDGTCAWIEWCFARTLKFGPSSKEMHGLPRVFAFDRTESGGWMCVMEKYDATAADKTKRQGYMEGTAGEAWFDSAWATIGKFKHLFEDDFFSDAHWANVMWSAKRSEWIVTDPSSCKYTSGAPFSQPSVCSAYKQHRVAAWKIPHLQRLHHMRV
jgi:hypothetical protein